MDNVNSSQQPSTTSSAIASAWYGGSPKTMPNCNYLANDLAQIKSIYHQSPAISSESILNDNLQREGNICEY